MKNGKYSKRRGVTTKIMAMTLALMLVIGLSVGGTLAWLIAKPVTVENTFTYGDIKIGLAETTGTEYKFIPGVNITKDPTVTVDATSEDCYLFVKVVETDWPNSSNISYEIADGWNPLNDVENVYYRTVKNADEVRTFPVIKGNTITVSGDLTKEEIATFAATAKLTITAYAVQEAGLTVDQAWTKVPA